MRRQLLVTAGTGALLMAFSGAAAAQTQPVGVRAAGMGGAFTAVADDATATFWNPAGLASGAFVGVTVDVNALDRGTVPFVGLGTPPLGLSYFRTASSTAATPNGRNGAVENVAVDHAGATVVQSIGDAGLAIGGTFGLVHGNGATAFAADAGVMLAGAIGKIGVVVHNLTAPALGGLRLDRQVRAGVSIHVRDDLTVAADTEFLSVPSAAGEWRDAAVGAEGHPLAKLWVRSGVHWNTWGHEAAPVGSVGASVAVYGSLRADAQATFGSVNGDRGWGVGLSFVY